MRPTALVLEPFGEHCIHTLLPERILQMAFVLPFAAASVPASFLGGLITLDEHIYRQVLGVLLLFAVLRMLSA